MPETDEPSGTLLLRSPYGRGFPSGALLAEPYAERGYHVFMQSVRGTDGSSGVFEPMVHEADDAADTMRWLRDQTWFDGRLGTFGPSYLGFVQYGLMMDKPEELKASVVIMAPHDFGRAMHGNGIFALETFLGWSDSTSGQQRGLSQQEMMARKMSAPQRLGPVMNALPMIDAAQSTLEDHAPWYRQWLLHPDPRDEFWTAYDHTEGLSRTRSSVLLIAGWSDIFLEQTAQQYAALHDRGLDVAMTIGDWDHGAPASPAAATIHQQSLAWFDEHLAGTAPRTRKEPVRVQLAGPGEWLDLPAWPPRAAERSWSLGAEERLDATTSSSGADRVSFVYDPADPTPSLSGRTYTDAGRVDNAALEARPDVLTFTCDPIDADIDIVGFPTVELNLSVDNPYANVFVRVCDVDDNGVSTNITDLIRRLDPVVPAGTTQRLILRLDPCAYRVKAGHSVRLQISGGAHPRHARNLGVPEPQTTATATAPSRHTISLYGSRIVLPILPR